MTQHTPGPWSYEPNGAQYVGKGAYTQRFVVPEIKARLHGKSSEANARLIAAAPDLLTALRELLDREGADAGLHEIARQRARAAIAKATARD